MWKRFNGMNGCIYSAHRKMDGSNLQYLHYKIVLLHYRRYFVAQNDNHVMRSDLDLLTMFSQVHLVALRHSLQSGHLHLRRMPEADLTKEPWRFCGERNLLLVESTLHFLHVTATSITHCRCIRTLHLLLRAWTAHLIAHLVVHQPWTHFYFSYSSVTNTINGKVNEAKRFIFYLFFKIFYCWLSSRLVHFLFFQELLWWIFNFLLRLEFKFFIIIVSLFYSSSYYYYVFLLWLLLSLDCTFIIIIIVCFIVLLLLLLLPLKKDSFWMK